MKPNILIITANFYEDISSNLTLGAITELKKKAKVKKIIVPGVFEIPVIVAKNINKYDAFIALGCVIKGETSHYHHLCSSVISALTDLSVKSKKPIGNGILTCNNIKQALFRANPNKKNKGGDAAEAVISVHNIIK